MSVHIDFIHMLIQNIWLSRFCSEYKPKYEWKHAVLYADLVVSQHVKYTGTLYKYKEHATIRPIVEISNPFRDL